MPLEEKNEPLNVQQSSFVVVVVVFGGGGKEKRKKGYRCGVALT